MIAMPKTGHFVRFGFRHAPVWVLGAMLVLGSTRSADAADAPGAFSAFGFFPVPVLAFIEEDVPEIDPTSLGTVAAVVGSALAMDGVLAFQSTCPSLTQSAQRPAPFASAVSVAFG